MGAGSQREMASLFQQLTAVLVAVVPVCRCNAQPLTPEVPGRDQKPRESRVVLHGQGTRDSRKHLNLEGADLERWKETALKSPSQLCYISHVDCNVPACDSPGGGGVLPPPPSHSCVQRGCFPALLLHPTSSTAGPVSHHVPNCFLATM